MNEIMKALEGQGWLSFTEVVQRVQDGQLKGTADVWEQLSRLHLAGKVLKDVQTDKVLFRSATD